MNMPNPTEQKRIFLVTGILIILLIGIFYFRYKGKPVSLSQKKEQAVVQEEKRIIPTPTPEKLVGIYTVVTGERTVKVGGNVVATVSFIADGKYLDGTDVILRFDPGFLTASNTLTFGDYFTLYPRKEVNNEKGFIKVTALDPKLSEANTFLTPLFNASFRAKKTGQTTISFDFQKGTTSKTTLVEKETSKNILGKVNDSVLSIVP